ncbi:MAG TPA: type II toxin-antitoxin system VapC family toxin [Thermoplasmata archaeon]|nr:type II toxin-antitoxin system VapC family toxin [Thermoplasmata archaeon]
MVDASVLVKWFVQEPGSVEALALRDDFVAGDVELHAPAHALFEVLNALRYSPFCTEERCSQVQLALDGYAVRYHPLSGEVARRAIRLAYSKDLSMYDAAYLALAREISARVVTADSALAVAGGPDALLLREYVSSDRG